MFTLDELVNNSAVLAQRQGDTTYAALFPIWLNMGQMYAANKYDYWSELQKGFWGFSSVANQEAYYMPSDFDKPYRIYDFTNNLKPTMITRENYSDANISTLSNAQTGVPQYAMLYGINAIAYLPNGGFTVKVNSSSASDVGTPVCFIEGWLDSAQTILGSTSITISSADPTSYVVDPNNITFYGITTFTKSASTNGFISLQNNSGTLLGTIAPVDRDSRYPVLYLGLIPAASYNYEVLYKRKVKRMVNGNDYPFADIDDFLTTYAAAYAYSQEKETAERAAQMFSLSDKLLDMAIVNEMSKLGPNYQQKFTNQTAQSHRC